MRHRRQGLQVNTFPFLAVLLCAMGSLILLLLVIDRRARVVARIKALKAAELAAAADDKLADSERDEWEKRRRSLHDRLAAEELAATNEIGGLRRRLETTENATATKQAQANALLSDLEIEKFQFAHRQQELTEQRNSTARADEQARVSEAELAQLTDELVKMERTVSDLKEFRRRQQQTYSLVPYQGKRGDSRRPVYIECAARGVVFHPGMLAFEGAKFTPENLRNEIERRTSRTQTVLSSTVDKTAEKAYLLMLIRPNGITTYYKTLAALHGMAVEFGYEFIDTDWVLDFSEGESSFAEQPWMQAQNPVSLPAPSGNARKVAGTESFLSKESQGAWQSEDSLPNRERPSSRAALAPGNLTSRVASAPGDLTSRVASAPGDLANRVALAPQATARRDVSIPGTDLASTAGDSGTITQLPMTLRTNGTGQSPADTQHTDKGDVSNATIGAPRDIFSPPPVATSENFAKTGQPIPSQQKTENAGDSRTALRAQQSTEVRSGASNSKNTSGEKESSAGSGLSRDPLSGILPNDLKKKPARPLPFTGLLSGNRDWIILVECRADGVVLLPSRHHVPTAEFTSAPAGGNPLRDLVEQMIAKRQASRRLGELPYRPMIHFRVWPDGVRTYYLAYPILGALGLPMARENADVESK
jgi:hypothetical protein